MARRQITQAMHERMVRLSQDSTAQALPCDNELMKWAMQQWPDDPQAAQLCLALVKLAGRSKAGVHKHHIPAIMDAIMPIVRAP